MYKTAYATLARKICGLRRPYALAWMECVTQFGLSEFESTQLLRDARNPGAL